MFDCAVVGGGIVGLATARALRLRAPGWRIALLEKEAGPASHQSGHNSGVVHSGIYYAPGSLKARLAVAGARATEAYCREHEIPCRPLGKVIVATRRDELPRLEELYRRGQANGVPGLTLLDASGLRAIEPAVDGLRAIHVPGAGSVDYRAVATSLASMLEASGVELRFSERVTGLTRDAAAWRVETEAGELEARAVVACAGLYSDRVARLAGLEPGLRILPFRGEYLELTEEACGLVRGLVYPVPDPTLPFLGVHLTRTVDDRVEAGPNAVAALSREGYRRGQLRLGDALEMITYPGFWRLGRRYWRIAIAEEARSLSRRLFLADLRRLVPGLELKHLRRGGSGVRAQALERSGRLVDDFRLIAERGALHVLNAPSPAATAALAIAELIVERLAEAGVEVPGARA